MDSTESLVRELQRNGAETKTIEAKAARGGTPKVHDTLSSFSNQSEGGVILFGVDERDDFAVLGVGNAQEVQQEIAAQCGEMIPPVRASFEVAEVDGGVVVAAYIPGRPIHDRPVYRASAGITRGAYVRVGDADVHMTEAELYEIEAFKRRTRDDVSMPQFATMDMLDRSAVAACVAAAKERRPRFAGRSQEEALRLLGIERHGVPTLAGLMALGEYPQQVYPNCCLTAVAIAGSGLGAEPDRERFIDNKYLEGSIPVMIEEAVAFVLRNTTTRSFVRGVRREDVSEYPEVAVREIVANALMHRDYGPYSIGTPVRLAIFSNRLECWNPGGLFGGLGLDELESPNSLTRNPTLVSLLEAMGVAENRHSGILAIRDAMRRAGLKPPVFQSSRASFTVCLYNSPNEGSDDVVRHMGVGLSGVKAASTPMARNDVSVERDFPTARNRTATEERIVAFCTIPRTREEVAEHVGLQERTVNRMYLNPLVEQGRLALTLPDRPRSKFQRYVKAESDSRGTIGASDGL